VHDNETELQKEIVSFERHRSEDISRLMRMFAKTQHDYEQELQTGLWNMLQGFKGLATSERCN
jgi:hypothetical protein